MHNGFLRIVSLQMATNRIKTGEFGTNKNVSSMRKTVILRIVESTVQNAKTRGRGSTGKGSKGVVGSPTTNKTKKRFLLNPHILPISTTHFPKFLKIQKRGVM